MQLQIDQLGVRGSIMELDTLYTEAENDKEHGIARCDDKYTRVKEVK